MIPGRRWHDRARTDQWWELYLLRCGYLVHRTGSEAQVECGPAFSKNQKCLQSHTVQASRPSKSEEERSRKLRRFPVKINWRRFFMLKCDKIYLSVTKETNVQNNGGSRSHRCKPIASSNFWAAGACLNTSSGQMEQERYAPLPVRCRYSGHKVEWSQSAGPRFGLQC